MLYLYGWLVARLAVRWLRINPADPLSLAQTGLPGLGAVGTLPAALSLFISLDALAASLLLLGALLIGLTGWREHRRMIACGLKKLGSVSGALWVLSFLKLHEVAFQALPAL